MKWLQNNPGLWLRMALLALLTGCKSPVVDHGDFLSARTMYDSKGIRSVWSRDFTTVLKKPLELKAVNLPGKLDPLNFGIGSVYLDKSGQQVAQTRPRGLLLIEVLNYPERKPLGKNTYDTTFAVKTVAGSASSKFVNSFILRISAKEAFHPHMLLRIIYRADERMGWDREGDQELARPEWR
jgi:hypothetical protein